MPSTIILSVLLQPHTEEAMKNNRTGPDGQSVRNLPACVGNLTKNHISGVNKIFQAEIIRPI